MEKNKGLFSFRKHPVGNFLDEKKGRKRKGGRLRRSMGFLMAAALIFNTLPASGLAVSASEQEKGLCEHHPEHTAECGYAEAQPCTHEHGEECYTTVTECVHTHTDGCYPETGETEESTGEGNATPSDAGNREPSLCTHVCSEESGCVTKVLDCHHEHDENCGYQEAQDCGYVCEICNGTEPEDTGENTEDTGTDTAKCICETLCTEDSINGGCLVCGADDASLLDCKGKVSEENMENQEDTGICKHHQEHNVDCGYIPKSEDGEGSPCTYECRICPIEDLIAALPDTVTEDNAEEVRAQLEEILALYRELGEDEQEEINLSRIYALQGALDAANAPMTVDGHTEQQDTDEASVTTNGEMLYYATLGEAFDAANGKTATITMLNDAECIKSDSSGSPLSITSGTVTLDMNGKTLSGKGCGNFGIVNVSGGSLLVQGKGTVKVTGMGLSCRGGKLTVADTNFELIGNGMFYSDTAVCNWGGTIIINGGKIIGPGSYGQIHQYSGNTTINNMTATESDKSQPDSVQYYNKGTLTINGGTFDKITVDSDNYSGVTSVAELLGEGCAYKKQDGTWATDDELAGLEISNVTVEKIPLTINPQGDTSWYYSTQQTHTLTMNAVPVSSDNSVTYVWKNGNETLDCTSDTCTVPADTPVGSYTYTCEATCDGYTLSHTFTFKIEQSDTEFTGGIKTYNGETETTSFTAGDTITVKATPTATGAAPQKAAARLRGSYTEPTAGQMALFVGDVQVSKPVQVGADGIYTMTVSAAEVLLQGNAEQNGNAITLTAKFVGNDNMADGAGTVDVNISAVAMAERDGAVIGYFGVSNFEGTDNLFFQDVYKNATITLLSDVQPGINSNTGETCSTMVNITCTLDLAGHKFSSTDIAIYVLPEGNLTVRDNSTDKTGNVSFIKSDGTLKLYGGTFGKIETASNLADLLAENCAYYRGSTPILLSELEGQPELTGFIIVGECQHTGVEVTNLGDGKHGLTCPYCGYNYSHNNTLTATASGNNATLNGVCGTEGCGYQTTLGTTSFTFPKVTYGQSGDVTCTWDGPTGYYGLIEVVVGSENQFDKNEDENIAERSWTLAQLFGNTKVTAGKHKLKVSFFSDFSDVRSNECELDFTIDPAPLTDSMATLDKTEVTYSGAEQKPTLTVKNGETTPLTEGTDYEVIYTRDGVVTNDFTSAGAVKITVTGQGNYGGKLEKTFTIEQAESDVGTVTAETLENTLDVSQVVLNRTNQTLAGTLMLTDSALKYGTNTYTWKFTPDNTNYKTVTGEVEVTVDDTTPPTGEISIGTNKWNSFLNKITFGLFFKKTEQVTITAQDNESGVASVSYYISDGGLTEDEVKALDSWTAGNTDKTTFNISPDKSCVVYARITDNQGNVTYVSSDGMVFDGTSPSITGVTDGETYCTSQTMTVTDDNLESVTVNGKEQALSDSKFTLDVKFDTMPIVIAATDKAGNVTTVTVNAGHNYGTDWKSDSNGHWQECAVCGEKSEMLAHTEDSGTVTKPATETEAGTRVYRCSACGYEMRTETIDPIPPTHTHSYGTEWKSDSNNHWHECSCDAAIIGLNQKTFYLGFLPIKSYYFTLFTHPHLPRGELLPRKP